jgi:hypothetical protein
MIAQISLDGCDDSTSVTVHVSPVELELLKYISDEIDEASNYHCQPTMSVTVVDSQAEVLPFREAA